MDFKGRARIHSHLDIAPLIDIVFLLLVFFMLTSTFLVPEAIELELPESSTSAVVDSTAITVSLNEQGQVALNGESIELADLQPAITALLEQDENVSITLKSDAQTEVQQLLKLMDEIRAAGGKNLALATIRK